MIWTKTDNGTLRVSTEHKVVLHGYPEEAVHFDAPSNFSRVDVLELLVTGWRTGYTRFERMTEAEVQAMEVLELKPRAMLAQEPKRIDVGKRPARPLETRSKYLGAAKHTVVSGRRTDCIEDRPLPRVTEDGEPLRKRRRHV